jgi:hypothetical protein
LFVVDGSVHHPAPRDPAEHGKPGEQHRVVARLGDLDTMKEPRTKASPSNIVVEPASGIGSKRVSNEPLATPDEGDELP